MFCHVSGYREGCRPAVSVHVPHSFVICMTNCKESCNSSPLPAHLQCVFIAPPIKAKFFVHSNLGCPCDFLWSIESGRMDAVPVGMQVWGSVAPLPTLKLLQPPCEEAKVSSLDDGGTGPRFLMAPVNSQTIPRHKREAVHCNEDPRASSATLSWGCLRSAELRQ